MPSSTIPILIRVLSSVLLLHLCFIVSGCGRPESRVEAGNRAGILHVGNGVEPQDLDPHTNTGSPESRILSALFEGLIEQDGETLQPIPGVAHSWEISPDGLAYSFHLREDAFWSDGPSLTAHDFVASFHRLLMPELAAEFAYMAYPVVGAEDFHSGWTNDFSTVGSQGSERSDHRHHPPGAAALPPESPRQLPLGPRPHPCHREIWWPDPQGHRLDPTRHLVGNGPFVLKEWVPNQVVEVVKNPVYWDVASVRLNAIHFHPIESQETVERAFRSGQLHATASLPVSKIAVYRRDNPEALRIEPRLGVAYLMCNTTRPPFNQREVRHAFSLAISRKLLVEKVLQGGQRPAMTLSQPGMGGFNSEAKLEGDPSEIPGLLAQAGYPEGQGIPEIEYLYNTSEGNRNIAETLQEMWRRTIGADVQLTNQEWKVFLDNRTDGPLQSRPRRLAALRR